MIPLGIFPLVKTPVQAGGLQPFAVPPPMLPFELLNSQNARNQAIPISEFNPLTQVIPYQLGQYGLVEVINFSPFVINVALGGGNGSINQEQYSKCIYRAQQGAMGQLTLTVTPLQCSMNFNSSAILGLEPVVIVNTYQDGEIEPYPPFSLNIPPAFTCPQFASFADVQNTTVTVDGSAGGSYTPPVSDHWLLGFDYSQGAGSAVSSGDLTIQNLAETMGSTNGKLLFRLRAETSGPPTLLQVRFPGPLPNNPGFPIQFVCPNLTGVTANLNVYYLR